MSVGLILFPRQSTSNDVNQGEEFALVSVSWNFSLASLPV